MDLSATIKINKQILALIESKYSEPPSLWPTSPESQYYNHLVKDTQKAEEALKHEGLSPIVEENKL